MAHVFCITLSVFICSAYVYLILKLKKQLIDTNNRFYVKEFAEKLIEKFGFLKVLTHNLIFGFALAFVAQSFCDFINKLLSLNMKARWLLLPALPFLYSFRFELEKFIHKQTLKRLELKFGNFKHKNLIALLIEYSIAGILFVVIIILARTFLAEK